MIPPSRIYCSVKLCDMFNDSIPSARGFKPPFALNVMAFQRHTVRLSGNKKKETRNISSFLRLLEAHRSRDPRRTGSTTSSRRKAGKTRLLLAPQDEKDLSPTTGYRQIFSVRRFRHRRDHLLLCTLVHMAMSSSRQHPVLHFVEHRHDDDTKCTKSSAFE